MLNRVLSGLSLCIVNQHILDTSEKMLLEIKEFGLTVGVVDLIIVAQARHFNFMIYNKDKIDFR